MGTGPPGLLCGIAAVCVELPLRRGSGAAGRVATWALRTPRGPCSTLLVHDGPCSWPAGAQRALRAASMGGGSFEGRGRPAARLGCGQTLVASAAAAGGGAGSWALCCAAPCSLHDCMNLQVEPARSIACASRCGASKRRGGGRPARWATLPSTRTPHGSGSAGAATSSPSISHGTREQGPKAHRGVLRGVPRPARRPRPRQDRPPRWALWVAMPQLWAAAHGDYGAPHGQPAAALPPSCLPPAGSQQTDSSSLGAARRRAHRAPGCPAGLSRPVAAAACPPLYRAGAPTSNPDPTLPYFQAPPAGWARWRSCSCLCPPLRCERRQRRHGGNERARVERRGGDCLSRGLHRPWPGL